MFPVLLRIGPLTVYSYGLMMALGFITGDYLLTRECRRGELNPDYANALVLWAAIAGIVGARIYAVLDDLPAYLADPKAIIFSGSGFVFYGGLAGGIVSTWVVARRYGISFARTTDLCVPALSLGQGFGRLGCQVSGDGDWGLPSKMPWAMAYPHAIVGWNAQSVLKLDDHYNLVSGYYPGVRVLPTPVFEAITFFVLSYVLIQLLHRPHVAGKVTAAYLVLAGLERFIVEFWRINPRVLWCFSEAQLISVVLIMAGAVIWLMLPESKAAEEPREVVRA